MEVSLLALETATDHCSVALLRGLQPEVSFTLSRPRAHAEHLIPLVQSALLFAALPPDQVGVVAVSMGPGSYTGLRIGVSAAKGFALAMDARLIGIPTLEALAEPLLSFASAKDVLCATLHARRGECYIAAFEALEEGLQPLKPTAVVALDRLADWLPEGRGGRYWFTGNASREVLACLAPEARAEAFVAPPGFAFPTASAVARLAQKKMMANDYENVSTFEPLYLKAFIARTSDRSVYDRLPF